MTNSIIFLFFLFLFAVASYLFIWRSFVKQPKDSFYVFWRNTYFLALFTVLGKSCEHFGLGSFWLQRCLMSLGEMSLIFFIVNSILPIGGKKKENEENHEYLLRRYEKIAFLVNCIGIYFLISETMSLLRQRSLENLLSEICFLASFAIQLLFLFSCRSKINKLIKS